MYRVYDNCGEPLRWGFSSKSAAYSFIALMGRAGDWKVKETNSKYNNHTNRY